jgi:type III restriction enzyme
MKLKFKHQPYQTAAVEAVADCFAGQPRVTGARYRIDPGRPSAGAEPQHQGSLLDDAGFRNQDFQLADAVLLANLQRVQRAAQLPVSEALVRTPGCAINLDVEMETGTGKTYCYIKTMFELYRRYGWGKFIVVVPSIAIREGVLKSFEITAEHFLQDYGKRARFFVYDSKALHNLEGFSSDAGINCMIINVQAFNATGKDARRINEELDDFQSRRPIDVLSANRPILILDEPQKMEGKKTREALAKFKPLFMLRYSATHRTEHNRVYRLDALDAYNQKLVKRIAVRGITVRGLPGTTAYLYLEGIEISPGHPPRARMELQVRRGSGIRQEQRLVGRNDNLFDLSGGLDAYKDGFVVADIDAHLDRVGFVNGRELTAGQATGDLSAAALRRIQIREAIRAHFQKERALFHQGVKVLTLFFIDEVAKYRRYGEDGELPGEYALTFEEEYRRQLNEVLELDLEPAPDGGRHGSYQQWLRGIDTGRTHDGYFSIDRKTRRLVDPKLAARSTETDDTDAYDLILKDKERLLSFDEPVRFIFSHSALREGWDNPNVFVICTLKHSDSTVSRRQEVGRGLRLAVNQAGERLDDPATVHQTNVLTVIASESYRDFVAGLQRDISETLSARPRLADDGYFVGKVLAVEGGALTVDARMATQIQSWLLKNDYCDFDKRVTPAYYEARAAGTLAPLPQDLAGIAEQVFMLVDGLFSDAQLPAIDDDRRQKENPVNANLHKREFQALWERINRKAAYTVELDTDELVPKCIAALDGHLVVTQLQYRLVEGRQKEQVDYDELKQGQGFDVRETESERFRGSIRSAVRYDLVGRIAAETQLTRHTIARVLAGISAAVFEQYRRNPEDFMIKAGQLINEQKATLIVEHLAYDPLGDRYELDIFTQEKPRADFSRAVKTQRHVYDYVFTDSKAEEEFVAELDAAAEVVVYAKLPRGFFIPTPVGNYNPDWAIAFDSDRVRHVYFVAETKGSLSSLQLREIEQSKIRCARKFFSRMTSDQVRYDVVDGYARLLDLVR